MEKCTLNNTGSKPYQIRSGANLLLNLNLDSTRQNLQLKENGTTIEVCDYPILNAAVGIKVDSQDRLIFSAPIAGTVSTYQAELFAGTNFKIEVRLVGNVVYFIGIDDVRSALPIFQFPLEAVKAYKIGVNIWYDNSQPVHKIVVQY